MNVSLPSTGYSLENGYFWNFTVLNPSNEGLRRHKEV